MAAFQQTSMTFGQAKTEIAESISRQNTSEFLTRAGKALQHAFRKWNRYNWRWLAKTAADYTAAAGDTSIASPFDLKDVYTLRLESAGRQHAVIGTPRRLTDRVIRDQTVPSDADGYNLFTPGSITFAQPLEAAGTLRLDYYRRMTLPCTIAGTASYNLTNASAIVVVATAGAAAGVTLGSLVTPSGGAGLNTTYTQGYNYPVVIAITDNSVANGGNVQLTLNCTSNGTQTPGTLAFGGDNVLLDIPEDYTYGILAEATHKFLAGTGAPQNRLDYWRSEAERVLQDAIEANSDGEDEDTAFEIGGMHANPNPLRTII